MFSFTKWQGESMAQTLDLPQDATLKLPRAHGGTLIRVEAGTLLVTREGDGVDHVLSAGMELCLPSAGLSVAWALASSRFQVRQPGHSGRALPRAGRPAAAGASC
jgi:hypothetical protein